MHLQMKNGLQFVTTDKINEKACAETVDVGVSVDYYNL